MESPQPQTDEELRLKTQTEERYEQAYAEQNLIAYAMVQAMVELIDNPRWKTHAEMFKEISDQSVLAKGKKWLVDHAQRKGHLGDRTLLSIEALFRYYWKRIIELPLRKASKTSLDIEETKKIIRRESDEFAKQIRESSEKI